MREPARGCRRCPRLASFRKENKRAYPDWHNGPAPSWGPLDANLLIVGLAPGLKGANRTGRVFTGDGAGVFLFSCLQQTHFVTGSYADDAHDTLTPVNIRITNAVACVPPQNRPTGEEMTRCNPFLKSQINAMKNLRAILCLGTLAHGAVLKALSLRKSKYPFQHGRKMILKNPAISLFNSYHCSRYNTQTGRLTEEMFKAVLREVKSHIDA